MSDIIDANGDASVHATLTVLATVDGVSAYRSQLPSNGVLAQRQSDAVSASSISWAGNTTLSSMVLAKRWESDWARSRPARTARCGKR